MIRQKGYFQKHRKPEMKTKYLKQRKNGIAPKQSFYRNIY